MIHTVNSQEGPPSATRADAGHEHQSIADPHGDLYIQASPGPTPQSRSNEWRAPQIARPEYEPSNNFRAIGFAMGGALIGALLWGGIVALMHIEIGYVAWAIGGIVGGLCAKAGGRGQGVAIACAALTLVSIFGGKLFGANVLIGRATEQLRPMLSVEVYEQTRQVADAYAALPADPSHEDVQGFLAGFGFSVSENADEVTEEEVAEFRESFEPELVAFNASAPDFQQWQDSAMSELTDEDLAMTAVLEELSAIDILFALLGVTTAFGLVMSATRRDGLA